MMVLALLAIAGSVAAQQKESKFEFGANIGMDSYVSHPAVSLLADEQSSYTTPRYDLRVGKKSGNMVYGLRVGFSMLNTSHVELGEVAMCWDMVFESRGYRPLSERWDLVVGYYIGARLTGNYWDGYSETRYGISMGTEFGVSRRFDDGKRVGLLLNASAPNGHLTVPDQLPNGLQPTKLRTMNEFRLVLDVSFPL